MHKRDISIMRSILRYNANRAYMGDLTGAELNGAFELFVRSRDWEKPIISTTIHTGYIDGTIICRAVWHEMSYNPKRFGTVSPFLHNGRENIYHFCQDSYEIPLDTPGYPIVVEIRKRMRNFLFYNKLENGSWYDVVDSSKGNMVVRFVSGASDNKYKMLATLRDMIHLVASQNSKDVNIAAYRNEMKPIIDARHPNGVRAKKEPFCADAILASEKQTRELQQAHQERMDDAEDNAQITAENRNYVSPDQYDQAVQDLEQIRNKIKNNNDQHTI